MGEEEAALITEDYDKRYRFCMVSLKMVTNNMIDRMPAQIPSMRFGLATATKGTVCGEAEFARLAVNRRPNLIRKPARFVKFVFDIRYQASHTSYEFSAFGFDL